MHIHIIDNVELNVLEFDDERNLEFKPFDACHRRIPLEHNSIVHQVNDALLMSESTSFLMKFFVDNFLFIELVSPVNFTTRPTSHGELAVYISVVIDSGQKMLKRLQVK